MVVPVPINILVSILFGLAYAAILRRAYLQGVYRVPGGRFVAANLVCPLLGLFAAITWLPALYLAFGFHEFSAGPIGDRLNHWLHRLAQSQVAYLGVYGLLILLTVRQH